jgi:hypothetical protein
MSRTWRGENEGEEACVCVRHDQTGENLPVHPALPRLLICHLENLHDRLKVDARLFFSLSPFFCEKSLLRGGVRLVKAWGETRDGRDTHLSLTQALRICSRAPPRVRVACACFQVLMSSLIYRTGTHSWSAKIEVVIKFSTSCLNSPCHGTILSHSTNPAWPIPAL